MATTEIKVQRFSVISSKSFQHVVAAFEAPIGHPQMTMFAKNLAAARTLAEMETIVRAAIGPAELMEFTRMNLGDVLRKRTGPELGKVCVSSWATPSP